MVYVVLRTGKVVRYNSGGRIAVEDGCLTVRTPCKQEWLVARIPLDIVERAEFGRPCAVERVSIKKGRDYTC